MEISLRFLTEPKKLNLYFKDVETQLIIAVSPLPSSLSSTWAFHFGIEDKIKCDGTSLW